MSGNFNYFENNMQQETTDFRVPLAPFPKLFALHLVVLSKLSI